MAANPTLAAPYLASLTLAKDEKPMNLNTRAIILTIMIINAVIELINSHECSLIILGSVEGDNVVTSSYSICKNY